MKARDKAARIQAMEERIRALYQRDERLHKEAVLADAKKASSPLHSYFEWDDTKAAHAHRLEQAGKLIRSIRWKVEYTPHTVRAPVYVQDTRAEEGYVSVEDLKSDEEYAAEVLERRLGAIHTQVLIAQSLAADLGLTAAFQEFLVSFDKLRERVRKAA